MSNQSETTLVLKGNSTHLVGEQKKFTQEVGKGAKEADKTSAAFEKTAKSIGRTLIGAGALKMLLQQTAQAVEQATQKMADLSKSAGSTALRRDTSMARLGLANKDITAPVGFGGFEGQAGLLEAIANSENLRGVVNKEQVNQALLVGARGTHTTQEILKGLEEGRPVTLNESSERESKFGLTARRELDRLRSEGGQAVEFMQGVSRRAGMSRAIQRGKDINAVNDPIISNLGMRNLEPIWREMIAEQRRQTAIIRESNGKQNYSAMTDSQ